MRKYNIYQGNGMIKHYCERTPMVITAIVCIMVLLILGMMSCKPITKVEQAASTHEVVDDHADETIGERLRRLNHEWSEATLK